MKRKDLPKSVKLYTQKCGGVIVGSAAEPGKSIEQVTDIDVLIPFSQWGTAAVIASFAAIGPRQNSYGGLRYTEINSAGVSVSIDVWPQELAMFMGNGNVKFIWFPQHDYRWVRGASGAPGVVNVSGKARFNNPYPIQSMYNGKILNCILED